MLRCIHKVKYNSKTNEGDVAPFSSNNFIPYLSGLEPIRYYDADIVLELWLGFASFVGFVYMC